MATLRVRASVEELLAKVERLIAARRRSAGELRELRLFAQDLLEVRDRERKEVAHELHESTIQSLAAIKINLSMARDSAAALNPEMQQALTDAVALLDLCSSDIEAMCGVLYPPLLDHVGLAAAMDWHLKGFMQSSGVRTVLDVPDDLGFLPAEHKVVLFRVMQEGLNKVRRYSASRTARVRLYRSATEVGIEVSAGRTRRGQEESRDAGATAIRERVGRLGGRLEIASGPRGTALRAALPLAPPAAEARRA